MTRAKAAFVALAALALAFPPAAALQPDACAGEAARAVLVVDTGDGSAIRLCVTLRRTEVSGIDLIRLASQQHGLQYRLGFGGGAVCQLAGVGPSGDDCFADDPYFWGYWRGDGSGGWVWSSSGAASTRVRNGSVEGWSWGTGRDGNTHPRPPTTAFSSVCPVTEEPSRPPASKGSQASASSKGKPAGGGDEVAGSGSRGPSSLQRPSTSDEEPEPKRKRREKELATRASPAPVASPTYVAALPPGSGRDDALRGGSEEQQGSPAAGLTGLAVVLLFAGAAIAGARRRAILRRLREREG